VSERLIERLPGFLRDELQQRGFDTATDEAVQGFAGYVILRFIDEISETEPGFPFPVGTALVVTADKVELKLWLPGRIGSVLLRLHPDYTKAEFRTYVVDVIRAMQRVVSPGSDFAAVSPRIIERLPKFLRDEIAERAVDTTRNRQVYDWARFLLRQFVNDVSSRNNGPVLEVPALYFDEWGAEMAITALGWWGGLFWLRLHPGQTEAEIEAVVASVIRMGERERKGEAEVQE
jgi:hypothetical protein